MDGLLDVSVASPVKGRQDRRLNAMYNSVNGGPITSQSPKMRDYKSPDFLPALRQSVNGPIGGSVRQSTFTFKDNRAESDIVNRVIASDKHKTARLLRHSVNGASLSVRDQIEMQNRSINKVLAPMTALDKSLAYKMQKNTGKNMDHISVYKRMHALDPGPIYQTAFPLGAKSPTKSNPQCVKFYKSKIPNFID